MIQHRTFLEDDEQLLFEHHKQQTRKAGSAESIQFLIRSAIEKKVKELKKLYPEFKKK